MLLGEIDEVTLGEVDRRLVGTILGDIDGSTSGDFDEGVLNIEVGRCERFTVGRSLNSSVG